MLVGQTIVLLDSRAVRLTIRKSGNHEFPGYAYYVFGLKLCGNNGCEIVEFRPDELALGETTIFLLTVNKSDSGGYREVRIWRKNWYPGSLSQRSFNWIRIGILNSQPVFQWHTGLPADHSRMISEITFWKEYCPTGICSSEPILHVFDKVGGLGHYAAKMDVRLPRVLRTGEKVTLVESQDLTFFIVNRGDGMELAIKVKGETGYSFGSVPFVANEVYSILFMKPVSLFIDGSVYENTTDVAVYDHRGTDLVWSTLWVAPRVAFDGGVLLGIPDIPDFTLGPSTSHFILWDVNCYFECEEYNLVPIVDTTR
jgi:hypothetical protein